MQGLAARPGENSRTGQGVDAVDLVFFGDRRKAHDLPILLRLHMTDQIVLVQPVHDHDDRPVMLVVEARVESVVEPLVRRPPLGL
jgi:hypothetical protein